MTINIRTKKATCQPIRMLLTQWLGRKILCSSVIGGYNFTEGPGNSNSKRLISNDQCEEHESQANKLAGYLIGRDLVYFTMAAAASNVTDIEEDIVSDLLCTKQKCHGMFVMVCLFPCLVLVCSWFTLVSLSCFSPCPVEFPLCVITSPSPNVFQLLLVACPVCVLYLSPCLLVRCSWLCPVCSLCSLCSPRHPRHPCSFPFELINNPFT